MTGATVGNAVAALGVVMAADPAARARGAAELGAAGLRSVASGDVAVLLEDAARIGGLVVLHDPVRSVPAEELGVTVRALAAMVPPGGAVAVTASGPVTDTLKIVSDDGVVHATADRERHATLLSPVVVPAALLAKAADARTLEEVLRAVVDSGGSVIG